MVWILVIAAVGLNFTIWGMVGLLRFLGERRRRWARRNAGGDAAPTVTIADVAVLIAAHNEELVIAETLRAVGRLVPISQVHVVSDGSTDRTAEIVQAAGACLHENAENLGKIGSLQAGIEEFQLVERYQAMVLLDADTQLDDHYFEAALPLLDDPEVVAVAGFAKTHWRLAKVPLLGKFLIAHRERIYVLTQVLLKYGQTSRRLNATPIVPGFASIYRTSVLPSMTLDPGGLVIEDFNMTFEVYRSKLGRVALSVRACAYTQDPAAFRDYVRQVRRWSLGFWQTVRRHGFSLNLFSGMLTLLILELLISSVFLLMLPLLLLALVGFPAIAGVIPPTSPVLTDAHDTVASYVSVHTIVLGVIVPDYALTCFVAIWTRRPVFLLLGLMSLPLRLADASMALYTFPQAWLVRSTGRWKSPTRRQAAPAAVVDRAAPVLDTVVDVIPVATLESAQTLANAGALPSAIIPQPTVQTGSLPVGHPPTPPRTASPLLRQGDYGGRDNGSDHVGGVNEDGSQDHRTRALALPLVAAVLAVAILAAAAIAYRSDPRNPAASLRDEPPVALVDIPPGPTAGVRIVEREVAQALTTSVRISLPGVSPGRLLPNAAFGVTIGDRFLTPVVEPLTTAPRSVAIVIDTEGQDLAANRQAAANGVTELLAQLPRNSRVALLDARGGVLAPLTADLSTLVHAASGAARTDGAPRIDAVDNALKETTRKAAGDRAAIVLVGSSLLEHARPTVTNLAQDARAMDAPVYSIGRSRQTVPAVRQLINASGGYMQVVSDSAPLESFDGVAADLVNQYRVTFRDSMHGSDPVTLRVNGVGSVPVT